MSDSDLHEVGSRAAASAFVDAGSVFGYKGPTTFAGQTAQVANTTSCALRPGSG